MERPCQTEVSRFSRKDEASAALGGKLFKGVAVSFGLLCVLQVSLNICLRLCFLTKSFCESEVRNLTEEQEQLFQQGWIQFGSSFYYISTVRKPWQKSRDDCLHRGADLMIIENQAEQNFGKALFRKMWVGVTDAANEGVWKWVDGTLLNETSFWCPEEPNNTGNEDCAVLNFFNQGCWNDVNCKGYEFWICEKKLSMGL